jgi:hypothetical protein
MLHLEDHQILALAVRIALQGKVLRRTPVRRHLA